MIERDKGAAGHPPDLALSEYPTAGSLGESRNRGEREERKGRGERRCPERRAKERNNTLYRDLWKSEGSWTEKKKR